MGITDTLSDIALVAVGGATGAVCRFGVQSMDIIQDNSDKYIYTLGVNIAGCLLIGVLYAVMQGLSAGKAWQLLLMTGLLGGFTTYSSFALDSNLLLQGGMTAKTCICMFGTFFGGIAACMAGLKVTTYVTPHF